MARSVTIVGDRTARPGDFRHLAAGLRSAYGPAWARATGWTTVTADG